jgi:hypothetical protein
MCSGTATYSAPDLSLPATISLGDRAGTGHAVDDFYNGMYAYIYSSTNGDGQSREILNYVASGAVATLKSAFTIVPTGTIKVRVVENEAGILKDAYAKLAIMATELVDPTYKDWLQFLDQNSNLINRDKGAADQDLILLDEYLVKGKAIYEAVQVKGITAVPA